MHKSFFTILFLLCLCIIGISFTQKHSPFEKPSNFPEPVYGFRNNEVTEEGVRLGRKIFYDPILSADNTISCGSCHIQTAAFTHHGHDLSHGINDLLGRRNAPPLQNLAWYNSFMWDGGIFDLDLQPIAPITSPVEMGDTLSSVIDKLNKDPHYPKLFKKVFGSDKITTANLMKALSQFMITLISANSKYDKVMRKEGVSFTPEEEKGYEVYKAKCSSCHKEPLFTDQSFRNNGLRMSDEDDKGRFEISLIEKDKYKFKVPSLRNLSFTAPYMHDGRFYKIDEVLEHYDKGMEETPNLDSFFLRKDQRPGISLSSEEKSELKKFLITLNDTAFIKNPKFSEEQ